MKKVIITEQQQKMILENSGLEKLVSMVMTNPDYIDLVTEIAKTKGIYDELFDRIHGTIYPLIIMGSALVNYIPIKDTKLIKPLVDVLGKITSFSINQEGAEKYLSDGHTFDNIWFHFKKLRLISIYKQSKIPAGLQVIPNELRISLFFCNLTELPILDNLVGLKFNNTAITPVANDISQLGDLEHLQILKDSDLKVFPTTMSNRNLEILAIRGSELMEIPLKSIENFPNMEYLVIIDSKMSTRAMMTLSQQLRKNYPNIEHSIR